jgi:5'-nucleotidase/UDP-sugar diphosphatase
VALWPAALAVASAARPETIQIGADLTTRNVRMEESNLADLVADAIRAVEKSDIAFICASAFAETTIPKGSASVADLLKALERGDDTVVIVRLTGAQVRKALAHGLSLYPQKNSAFLQVSGIATTIDPSKEKEERVVSVKVGKNPLDDKKTYNVAMPSPLANGALAYFKVWGKADIDHETSATLAGAVTNYLSGMKSISGKSEERLVFK